MFKVARFSGGSRSLERFWYEVSAVSSSLASIKDKFSLHKSSGFMSGIITQKVIKILIIQSIQA